MKAAKMKIYSPWTDSFHDLICHFELHYDDKKNLIGASVENIETSEEVNLVKYLKDDAIEEIEQEFLSAQDEYFEGGRA